MLGTPMTFYLSKMIILDIHLCLNLRLTLLSKENPDINE